MTFWEKTSAAADFVTVFVLVTILWAMRYEMADED